MTYVQRLRTLEELVRLLEIRVDALEKARQAKLRSIILQDMETKAPRAGRR